MPTTSDDLGPVWEWSREVPPKAPAGEIEFLLRLGVLAAARVRGRGRQAAPGADRRMRHPPASVGISTRSPDRRPVIWSGDNWGP